MMSSGDSSYFSDWGVGPEHWTEHRSAVSSQLLFLNISFPSLASLSSEMIDHDKSKWNGVYFLSKG